MEKLLKPLIFLSIVVFAFTAYVVYEAAYRLSSLPAEFSAPEAAMKAINYINENGLTGGPNASLISVTEESGLYKIHILIGQDEYDSFISKDGQILFKQAVYMEESDTVDTGNTSTAVPTTVPKSDRPDVKIFVMSYCPYGLQAEKMMLPVYDLLKDKIDIGIYFVDYAMHGDKELDENLRQYCIESENQSQYFDYLRCFVQGGNSSICLTETGINLQNLASCISTTAATYNISAANYPAFNVQKDLNDLYGVTGSPTIIINGVKISISPRSPENFKQAVCSAFNSSPEECSQTLSTTAPSAGFD
jgi:glutaredoxin